MKKIFPFILYVLFSFSLYSQKAANIWHFGNKAGLDFNGGSPPVPLINGELNTSEGCASIADDAGNLLFYTDGIKVWDKNHLVMPNGTGLMGDESSTQSCIITPYPGNKNKYYVFVTDGFTCLNVGPKGPFDGLTYSVIDMNLNGGNGDVVSGFKNRGLIDSTREQVTAARHANGIDYWIITRKAFTNKYYAFLVTCNGIDSANPVITTIGSTAASNTTITSVGYLKTSPQSDAILSVFSGGRSELYDFNNSTGRLSNAQRLTVPGEFYYGASFSPDGKVLYIGGGSFLSGGKIYRYERFPTPPATTIAATEIVTFYAGSSAILALQLASDGKIYFTHPYFGDEVSLGVIHDPNNYTNPNMQYTYVTLGGKKSICGLPNFFDALHFYNPPIAGKDTTICHGVSAQIGTSAVAGLNYFWLPATGLSNSTVSNPVASPLVSTQYIMGAYNSCDTIYDTVVVNVLPAPILSVAQSSSSICKGSSITLVGSGAAGYSWSPAGSLSSGTTAVVTATPSVNTIYILTGTAANSCTSILTVSVNVSLPPVVSVNTPTVQICEGDHYTLSVAGASNYSWTPVVGLSSATGNIVTTSPSVTTLYTIIGTDANGCIDSNHIQVTILPKPIVNFSPQASSICAGSSVLLTVSGASTYIWFPSIGLSSTTGSNVIATPLINTSYTVVALNINGCSDSADIQLTVFSLPSVIVSPSNSIICNGDSVLLNAYGAGIYNWSPSTSLSVSTGSTVYAKPTTTTLYNIIGIDANGCSAVATATVTVPVYAPLVTSVSGNSSLCNGSSAILSASALGGTGNYTFLWNHGNASSTISITPTATTSYSVSVTDMCGNKSSASYTVIVFTLPDVQFVADDSSGCGPLCVNFLETTSTNSLLWLFGDGDSSTSFSPNHCYTVPGKYDVKLYVKDNNGCSNSISKQSFIEVYSSPVADFEATPTAVSGLAPVVNFTDKSIGAVSWSWSFGDVANSQSTLQHPSFTYADSGSYTSVLWIVNEYGCKDSASVFITVEGENSLYIPNTFTPNEDRLNEIFIPVMNNINPIEYKLLIYDRWGNLIFISQNEKIGWDGKLNDMVVQQDVYVWKLIFKDKNKNRQSYVGHVNVIR